MNAYLFPGVIGLLLGITLHWAGFSRPAALRDALGLHRSYGLRSGLYVLGMSMALTALLCWLAVIDVDGIVVLPLSAGVLAGGALFGVAAGLSGFTPATAFAGVGGGPVLEALSAIAGCLLAVFALPALEGPLSALQAAPPFAAATLFEVTLDEPFLLGGGFLGQGCAGLLLMTIAACIPSPKVRLADADAPATTETEDIPPEDEALPAEDAAPDDAATPVDDAVPESPQEDTAEDAALSAEDSAPDDAATPVDDAVPEAPQEDTPVPEAEATPSITPPPLPDAAPEETFVALLPGEEPLVIDTQLDDLPEDEPDKEPPIPEDTADALAPGDEPPSA